jgi:hypothetical protein
MAQSQLRKHAAFHIISRTYFFKLTNLSAFLIFSLCHLSEVLLPLPVLLLFVLLLHLECSFFVSIP